MSSCDCINLVFKCLSKGAVDFLVKPIRKNELKNLWQQLWRRCHSFFRSGVVICYWKCRVEIGHPLPCIMRLNDSSLICSGNKSQRSQQRTWANRSSNKQVAMK